MLRICQEWSVRNRIPINKQKTKVMAFFEFSSLQMARGRQHQPSSALPLFHMYTPFPTSDPHSHLIAEVLQFEYLGLTFENLLDFLFLFKTCACLRRAAANEGAGQS